MGATRRLLVGLSVGWRSRSGALLELAIAFPRFFWRAGEIVSMVEVLVDIFDRCRSGEYLSRQLIVAWRTVGLSRFTVVVR